MENTLNFVFDNWDDELNESIPNSRNLKIYNNITKEYFNNVGHPLHDILLDVGFSNYKKYKIEKIKDHPDKKFYYLIWTHLTLFDYVRHNSLLLSDNMIEYLKNNDNLYLIYINTQETDGFNTFKIIEELFNKNGLNQEKIYILNNNYKIHNLKEAFNFKFNVHNTKVLSKTTLNLLTDEKNHNKVKYTPIKKDYSLFLCHNNAHKPHRASLLILLKKFDILDDVDWSILDTNRTTLLYLKNNVSLYKNEIEYIYNTNKHSKYEQNMPHGVDWHVHFYKDSFEKSYFNIVTDSLFGGREVHITEKSFKPFMFYQFPLFVASHHHVKYMKLNFDFDYFDDIIDHSYDNVVDNADRLFKFVEEVKRIQENKDFFINFYKENKERFLDNYKKYSIFNNQHDIDFFNGLI